MLAAALSSVDLTALFVRAGDAAHEGRNLCAGLNTAAHPAVLCADTLLAQIEALGRELCALVYHRHDLTAQLRNALRCAACARQTLRLLTPEARDVDVTPEWIARLTDFCIQAETALREAGCRFARAIARQASLDFDLDASEVGPLAAASEYATSDREKNRQFMKEALALAQQEQGGGLVLPEGAADVLRLAAAGCNAAHGLQNHMSPFTSLAPFSEQANAIVNAAGNMENRFRAIQAHARNLSRAARTAHDPRSLAVALKKKATNVLGNIERVDLPALAEACATARGRPEGALRTEQAAGAEAVGEGLPVIAQLTAALEKRLSVAG